MRARRTMWVKIAVAVAPFLGLALTPAAHAALPRPKAPSIANLCPQPTARQAVAAPVPTSPRCLD